MDKDAIHSRVGGGAYRGQTLWIMPCREAFRRKERPKGRVEVPRKKAHSLIEFETRLKPRICAKIFVTVPLDDVLEDCIRLCASASVSERVPPMLIAGTIPNGLIFR
jgi:hypothetical protein